MSCMWIWHLVGEEYRPCLCISPGTPTHCGHSINLGAHICNKFVPPTALGAVTWGWSHSWCMALKHPARSRRWNTKVVWKTAEVSEPFKVSLYFLPPTKCVRAEMPGERALPRFTCRMLWWKGSHNLEAKSHTLFSLLVFCELKHFKGKLVRFLFSFPLFLQCVKYVIVRIKSLETHLSHRKNCSRSVWNTLSVAL